MRRVASLIALACLEACAEATPTPTANPAKISGDSRSPNVGATATLRVEVTGVEVERGTMIAALYADEKDFPDQHHSFRVARAKVTSNHPLVVFDDLPAGRYAIALFQDVDEDGALNRSFIGYPSEPFGFSNDAKLAMFGPPSFAACAFDVGASETTTRIALR